VAVDSHAPPYTVEHIIASSAIEVQHKPWVKAQRDFKFVTAQTAFKKLIKWMVSKTNWITKS